MQKRNWSNPTGNNYEICSILLGFGYDVGVTKPLSLWEKMQDDLIEAVNKYKTK